MKQKNSMAPHESKMNKQKQQAKMTRQQALNWLAKQFPEAFDNTLRIRPLKIGIMADIMTYADEALSAGISKTKLREAVVLYTRRIDYLTCLKAREKRIDLTGQPIEVVSEEDAERAAVKIRKRIEKACKHVVFSGTPSPVPVRRPTMMSPNVSKPTFKTHQDYTYNQTPRFQAEPQAAPKTTPSITIKRKSNRHIDPLVAQKLREKLDLEK